MATATKPTARGQLTSLARRLLMYASLLLILSCVADLTSHDRRHHTVAAIDVVRKQKFTPKLELCFPEAHSWSSQRQTPTFAFGGSPFQVQWTSLYLDPEWVLTLEVQVQVSNDKGEFVSPVLGNYVITIASNVTNTGLFEFDPTKLDWKGAGVPTVTLTTADGTSVQAPKGLSQVVKQVDLSHGFGPHHPGRLWIKQKNARSVQFRLVLKTSGGVGQNTLKVIGSSVWFRFGQEHVFTKDVRPRDWSVLSPLIGNSPNVLSATSYRSVWENIYTPHDIESSSGRTVLGDYPMQIDGITIPIDGLVELRAADFDISMLTVFVYFTKQTQFRRHSGFGAVIPDADGHWDKNIKQDQIDRYVNRFSRDPFAGYMRATHSIDLKPRALRKAKEGDGLFIKFDRYTDKILWTRQYSLLLRFEYFAPLAHIDGRRYPLLPPVVSVRTASTPGHPKSRGLFKREPPTSSSLPWQAWNPDFGGMFSPVQSLVTETFQSVLQARFHFRTFGDFKMPVHSPVCGSVVIPPSPNDYRWRPVKPSPTQLQNADVATVRMDADTGRRTSGSNGGVSGGIGLESQHDCVDPSLPSCRAGMSVVEHRGFFVMFGGISLSFGVDATRNDVWVYDQYAHDGIQNGGWSRIHASDCSNEQLPACRHRHTANVVSRQRMIVVGGRSLNDAANQKYFDGVFNMWSLNLTAVVERHCSLLLRRLDGFNHQSKDAPGQFHPVCSKEFRGKTSAVPVYKLWTDLSRGYHYTRQLDPRSKDAHLKTELITQFKCVRGVYWGDRVRDESFGRYGHAAAVHGPDDNFLWVFGGADTVKTTRSDGKAVSVRMNSMLLLNLTHNEPVSTNRTVNGTREVLHYMGGSPSYFLQFDFHLKFAATSSQFSEALKMAPHYRCREFSDDFVPHCRAFHSLVYWHDSLYVYGGERLSRDGRTTLLDGHLWRFQLHDLGDLSRHAGAGSQPGPMRRATYERNCHRPEAGLDRAFGYFSAMSTFGTWSKLPLFASPRRDHTAAVAADGEMILLGGVGPCGLQRDAWSTQLTGKYRNRRIRKSMCRETAADLRRGNGQRQFGDDNDRRDPDDSFDSQSDSKCSQTMAANLLDRDHDVQTDEEEGAATLPECRAGSGVAQLGKEFVVFGGTSFAPGSVQYRNSMWSYRKMPFVMVADEQSGPSSGDTRVHFYVKNVAKAEISNVRVSINNGPCHHPTAEDVMVPIAETTTLSDDADLGVRLPPHLTPKRVQVRNESFVRMECVTSPGVGANLTVVVEVRGASTWLSQPQTLFSYHEPRITGVAFEPTSTTGGTRLTVNGTNLGDANSKVLLLYAHTDMLQGNINRVSRGSAAAAGGTSSTSSGDDGAGRDIAAQVAACRQLATPNPLCLAVLQLAALRELPPVPGLDNAALTLWDLQRVLECTHEQHDREHTFYACAVPPGYGARLFIVVDAGGQMSNFAEVPFAYRAPVVHGVTVETKAAASKSHEASRIASKSAEEKTDSQNVAESRKEAATDGESDGKESVSVASDDAAAATDVPVVDDMYGVNANRSSTTGAALVSIHGENFGSDRVEWGGFLTVHIGEYACEDVTWVSHYLVTCRTPVGRGARLPLNITVGDQSGVLSRAVSYARPTITAMHTEEDAAAGGDDVRRGAKLPIRVVNHVTITGANFGSDISDVLVYVSPGGSDGAAADAVADDAIESQKHVNYAAAAAAAHVIPCQTSSFQQPHTSIVCVLQEHDYVGRYRLNVVVAGQRGTYAVEYVNLQLPRGMKLGLQAMAAITLVIQMLILGVVWLLRKVKSIRASSPTFLMVFNFGSMCMVAAVFTIDPADRVCVLSTWMLVIGFTLLFGAILLKNWRILTIFAAKSLRISRISDAMLLMRLAGFLLLDCVLLIPFSLLTQCGGVTGDGESGVLTTLALYKGVMLCGGVVIAVKSRVIDRPEFNERISLGYAIYNVAFGCFIIFPITLYFVRDPEAKFAVQAASLLVFNWFTLVILFAPKFHRVWETRIRGGGTGGKGQFSKVSGGRSTNGLSSSGSGAYGDGAYTMPKQAPSTRREVEEEVPAAEYDVDMDDDDDEEDDETVEQLIEEDSGTCGAVNQLIDRGFRRSEIQDDTADDDRVRGESQYTLHQIKLKRQSQHAAAAIAAADDASSSNLKALRAATATGSTNVGGATTTAGTTARVGKKISIFKRFSAKVSNTIRTVITTGNTRNRYEDQSDSDVGDVSSDEGDADNEPARGGLISIQTSASRKGNLKKQSLAINQDVDTGAYSVGQQELADMSNQL